MLFWLAALAGTLALACGGAGGPDGVVAPEPSATPFGAGVAVARYIGPEQQRTVTPLGNLPTRTPVGFNAGGLLPGATVTARDRLFGGGTPAAAGVAATPAVFPTATSLPPEVHDPEHTPGPPAYEVSDEVWEEGWSVETLSCFEDFFSRVTAYDGAERFGPEVLNRLSAEMLAARADCVLSGWSPSFVLGPVDVCRGLTSVGGVGAQWGITPWDDHMMRVVGRHRYVGPTEMGGARTSTRRFLMHLDRLPYSDGSGCWYGGPWHEFFYFSGETADGEYRHSVSAWRFPRCEAALRGVLPDMRESGMTLDLEAVLNARQLVAEEYGALCGRRWVITPAAGPAAGCRWNGPTGRTENGDFLVNWLAEDERGNPLTDARGGSPCWLLRADGTWEFSDPVAFSGIDYATGRAPLPP